MKTKMLLKKQAVTLYRPAKRKISRPDQKLEQNETETKRAAEQSNFSPETCSRHQPMILRRPNRINVRPQGLQTSRLFAANSTRSPPAETVKRSSGFLQAGHIDRSLANHRRTNPVRVLSIPIDGTQHRCLFDWSRVRRPPQQWRTRKDSNLRPSPSEGDALSS